VRTVTEGSFWEHLEEFRRRLILALAAVTAAAIAAFVFSRRLMDFVLSDAPLTLQTLAPAEAFTAHLTLSLTAGLVVSSPVCFYQFWRFVSPGLYRKERKTAVAATISCAVLFIAGVAFAWFIMMKPALAVFTSFETGRIAGGWSLSNYISFLGSFLLIFGAAFELPVLVILLVKMGVISPATLARYRRHVIVGLLILGAVLPPADPLTQVMLAVPLYLLFELSLLVARMGYRERREGE
jgi:sec-independent protein translocase protein TatC